MKNTGFHMQKPCFCGNQVLNGLVRAPGRSFLFGSVAMALTNKMIYMDSLSTVPAVWIHLAVPWSGSGRVAATLAVRSNR